jgi:methionine biosynthesis protein MetW
LTPLAGRSDFAVIGRIIAPKSRVLDLGCGEGELLEWLIQQKQVTARGVEISPARVRRAIARGVSAFQGDLNEGLTDFPDNAFDYVILSQTLQETHQPVRVIEEMLRVGKRAIVSFPNFGHWSVRASGMKRLTSTSSASPILKCWPRRKACASTIANSLPGSGG